MKRRRFLQIGFGGAVLLSLGGVGLALQETMMRVPARPLQVFGPRAFSVLAAIADRIAPGGRGLPSASELQVAETIDSLFVSLHPADAADLEKVLLVIENGLVGAILDGQPRPFTARSPEDQDATLEGLRSSALPLRRTMWKAVSGLITGTYWATDRTWAHAHYGGPPDFGNGRGTAPSRPPIVRTAMEGGSPVPADGGDLGGAVPESAHSAPLEAR